MQSLIQRLSNLLSHDFFPASNRWVGWLKHPLAILGLAAGAALSCGLMVNTAGYPVALVLGAVAVMGCGWPRIAASGLVAEAEFLQTRCRVGERSRVRLRIVNRLPFPVWGLSLRRGFLEHAGEADGIALAFVPGWSQREFEWVFVATVRGAYPLAAPSLDTGFPFGLWHATAPVKMRNEMLVWPRSVRLETAPETEAFSLREDRLSDRREGQSGDLTGTRPFRQGDSMRRVHWAQTARSGKLIVMERQAAVACGVRLAVDLNPAHHLITAEYSTLEQALSLAASVLECLHRNHGYVELQLGRQWLPVGEGSSDLRRGLDALARVPRQGLSAERHSESRLQAGRLPTIAISTEPASGEKSSGVGGSSGGRSSGGRSSGGRSAADRRICILKTAPGDESCEQAVTASSAWLAVGAAEDLEKVLPTRWRRACHAT